MATKPAPTPDPRDSIDADIARSTKRTLNLTVLIVARGWAARARRDRDHGRRTVLMLAGVGLMILTLAKNGNLMTLL